MARAAMGDRMDDFKSNRRTYLRGLDILEKEVVNINTPRRSRPLPSRLDADVVTVDMEEVLNDDDAETVDVELDQYNACGKDMFAAFEQALARLVAVALQRSDHA